MEYVEICVVISDDLPEGETQCQNNLKVYTKRRCYLKSIKSLQDDLGSITDVNVMNRETNHVIFKSFPPVKLGTCVTVHRQYFRMISPEVGRT